MIGDVIKKMVFTCGFERHDQLFDKSGIESRQTTSGDYGIRIDTSNYLSRANLQIDKSFETEGTSFIA